MCVNSLVRVYLCSVCVCMHVCLCMCVYVSTSVMSVEYVVYISSVWCLHQRPLSSYFNTTVWSAPIWSWSLCLCLLSKTLFISPCFSNPRSPTLLVILLFVCVCVCVCAGLPLCLLFYVPMCVQIWCRIVKAILHSGFYSFFKEFPSLLHLSKNITYALDSLVMFWL